MMHLPGPFALGASPESSGHYAKLDPKLVSAAHEFEASMMQELLRPMQSGSLFVKNSEDDFSGSAMGSLTASEDDSAGALMSFGTEAMAKALSEKGGLGIAKRIIDHFEKSGEAKTGTADKIERNS